MASLVMRTMQRFKVVEEGRGVEKIENDSTCIFTCMRRKEDERRVVGNRDLCRLLGTKDFWGRERRQFTTVRLTIL